jgi:hypothetical protein
MNRSLKYSTLLLPIVVILGGCAWKSDYDAAVAENNQLKQQVASLQAQNAAAAHQVSRLGGAVLYTLQVTGQVGGVVRPSGEWRSDAPVRL